MGLIYLDSAALVKLAVVERESAALLAGLAGREAWVSSVLAAVEVPRAVARMSGDPQASERADEIVRRTDLHALSDEVVRLSRSLPPPLRSLDAIHLATAMSMREALESFVTYDRRLVAAARSAGFSVLSPGAE